jgi:putative DNA primase/helicase
MAGETVERARGRWREVLSHPAIGIPPKHLVNKGGPCPVCGGKDRFRFDDKDGSGSFFCNQCGPGNGIMLVQRYLDCGFKQAADAVDRALGEVRLARVQAPTRQEDDTTHRQRAAERVLSEATDRNVVVSYLASRGLSVAPAPMQGHPGLAYHDSDGRMVGHFPAVVMPVHGPYGDLRAVHRIYVGDLDPRKKLTPPIRKVTSGAIRLFDQADTLGIAEGPETAIAAYERDGVPTWAGISSTILEGFQPPAGVRCVVVYGDNDLNFEGQRAAYSLANRLAREGYGVDVRIPAKTNSDWLDIHTLPEVA